LAWAASAAASGCDAAPPPIVAEGAAERAAAQAAEIAARSGVEPLGPEGLTVETPFSLVELRDAGPFRSLFFVGDDGATTLQTRMSLARPQALQTEYAKTMFASYLFQPEPSRVLVVGVGGGAMIRFLEHWEPELRIDGVDIDPEILALAERYFGTRPSERVRLLAADGYQFIRASSDRYDAIYLDAFLRPSEETDRAGVPRSLRSAPFYAAVRQRLSPGGVVALNLFPHPERARDVEGLRRAFPQLYLFDVPGELNLVAVATGDDRPRTDAELERLAHELDRRFGGALRFAEMLDRRRPAGGAAG
jgi:spermidine synthase